MTANEYNIEPIIPITIEAHTSTNPLHAVIDTHPASKPFVNP